MAEEPTVSTMELFFDLVFVFTITQLSHLVEDAHDALGYVRPLLVMIVIWWHYAGYVWLTNAWGAGPGEPRAGVPPGERQEHFGDARGTAKDDIALTSLGGNPARVSPKPPSQAQHMRFVLLAAMAGFLVMAISLPTLFSGGGLAFGLSYLFVVVLHLGAFLWAGGPAAVPGVARLAPINLGVAAFVLAAAFAPPSWSWLLFVAGVALFGVSTLVRVEGGFSVRAAHFAERHGLAVIIVLGESVIAIGAASTARALDAWTIVAVVLALGVIAALWWAYFTRDAADAEHALRHAPPAQQARLALTGYWYTHLLMLAGVVLLATGIRGVAPDPRASAPTAAWLVAIGVACYLVGTVAFRRAFGLRPLVPRLVAAAAVLVVGLAGAYANGLAALVLAALVLAGLALVEPNTPARA